MSLWDKLGKGLDMGLALVEKCLSFVREDESRAEQSQMSQLVPQKEFEQRVRSSIAEMSHKMEAIAQDVVNQISQKIESDQLEKLVANIKIVQLAAQFGEKSMLGPSLVTLSEHIEYAKNRLAEGKSSWFEPWMLAESIRIAVMLTMAAGEHARHTVHQITLDFRLNILNHMGPELIKATPSPWIQISAFVEGRNEDVLKLIGHATVSNNTGSQTKIIVGDIGDFREVTVSCLLVKSGDTIKIGQPVVNVETDKTVIDIPSSHAGVVTEIKAKVGDKVGQGSVLLYVDASQSAEFKAH